MNPAEAVLHFKKVAPYKVGYDKRKEAMTELVERLALYYGIPAKVFFHCPEIHDSCSSYASLYLDGRKEIHMVGKLSIITLLHEFAHLLGANEDEARAYSISLFKRCYPRAFGKLKQDGVCWKEA